jgi:hypothetical protein
MGTSSRHKIYLVRTTTSPLCYGNSRSNVLWNVEPDLNRKPAPDAWAVVTASILAASAFGSLCAYLLYKVKEGYSPHVYYKHVTVSMLGYSTVLGYLLLTALLFILIYPLIGLIVADLSRSLMAGIARIYAFEIDRRRHPNAFLLLASSWPITVWAIPFLTLALSMGLLCRSFWK